MISWGFILGAGLVLGTLFAIGLSVSFYLHIVDAAEHENTLLPFLIAFWIACVAGFVAYWLWFF